MARRVHSRLWSRDARALQVLLCAALSLLGGRAVAQAAAGALPTTITVEGRLLTGPSAFAERRAGRLFLPVSSIARALGDEVAVDPAARAIRVVRQTGVVAALNANSGQILENGIPVLVATTASDLPFPADASALYLPVELLSSLLDVQVISDEQAKTIRISREPPQVTVRAGQERGFFDLYQGRYGYSASATQNSFTHNLQLGGNGRAFDGLVAGSASLAGSTQLGLVDFRYGLLTYDRPDGQRFMLGDINSGADLTFLSTALRGGWYRQPFEALDVTTFAGVARSGAAPDPLTPEVPPSLNFDTPVVGTYFTVGRPRGGGGDTVISDTTGGMWFNGPSRRGGIASTALRYQTPLHTFQGEIGLGSFERVLADGSVTHSLGLLLDTTEAITATEALTLVAGFTHVDEAYLGPQSGGILRPMNLLSGGINWRVASWMTASLAGRHVERLDKPERPIDYDVTGTASLFVPGWPSVVVNHSDGVISEVGARQLTLVNVTKAFDGYNLFANFTRMRLGVSPLQMTLTAGGSKRFNLLTLSAYQTATNLGGLSGGLDLSTPSFFTPALAVSGGLGYSYDPLRGILPTARLALSAKLPANQLLQLNISQSEFGAQAFLEIAGPLYERAGGAAAAALPLQQLSTIGSFSGRVFQDADLDGAYDANVDRPLPNVQVMVDGSSAVLTDEQGRYHLANIQAGVHTVYLNLLTVRADLSLLTSARHQVELLPDRDAVIDFRLVRTGRIRGAVWLDKNGNGKIDPGEERLADVRVVSGKRDTLTNAQGEFILGDLPAGKQTVVVDEKTLPEGLRAQVAPAEVQVKPPGETRGVLIPVREKPREVEVKQF